MYHSLSHRRNLSALVYPNYTKLHPLEPSRNLGSHLTCKHGRGFALYLSIVREDWLLNPGATEEWQMRPFRGSLYLLASPLEMASSSTFRTCRPHICPVPKQGLGCTADPYHSKFSFELSHPLRIHHNFLM